MDKISICITLLDRLVLMQAKLEELRRLNFDPKRLEICVTDGGNSDELRKMLQGYAKHFFQIKYAFSDRSELPFVIPENNPACDINAQICHVASFSKIIRTDPEVRFVNKDSLNLIDRELSLNKELCLTFTSWHMNKEYVDGTPFDKKNMWTQAKMSFHCSCFWKEAFIRNRGVEERFALGFAAEDSYFHQWWRRNRKFKNAPCGFEIMHLWHGKWQTTNRLRLKHEYTLPMYKQFLRENHTPNEGNPDWQRPEIIKGVEIWKA